MNSKKTTKTPPLISVVMATHNYARFIGAAIDSILAQTHSHFELIIVDDASTDNTLDIIAQYNDKRIICLTRDDCACSGNTARNDGLAIAKGDFIAIADADEINVPNRLEWQVQFLQNNPHIDVLGGGVTYIDESGAPIKEPRYMPIYENPHEYRKELLQGDSVLFNPTMMIRKCVLDTIPSYSDCACSADFEFLLRASRYFNFYNLDKILIHRRHHAASVSQTYGPLLSSYYHKIFLIREHMWVQQQLTQTAEKV